MEENFILPFIFVLLLMSAVIAVILGRQKNKPILWSFKWGFILGPIGWLIVWFKKPVVQKGKMLDLVDFLRDEKTLSKKEKGSFRNLLYLYINILKIGRILILIALPATAFDGLVNFSDKFYNQHHSGAHGSFLLFVLILICCFANIFVWGAIKDMNKIINLVRGEKEDSEEGAFAFGMYRTLFLLFNNNAINEILGCMESYIERLKS